MRVASKKAQGASKRGPPEQAISLVLIVADSMNVLLGSCQGDHSEPLAV